MALKKRTILIPAIPLLMVAFFGIVAANAKYRYVHPFHPDQKFDLPDEGGPRLVLSSDDGEPRAAVVGDTQYDFGVLDPLSYGNVHTFTIKNTGSSLLRLGNGGSTCKCTTANIKEPFLEPGEQTEVEVEFNTGRDHIYKQTAIVSTNDPLKKSLKFTIQGKVRLRIGAAPLSTNFGRVDPQADLPKTKSFIHSKLLSGLTLLNVQVGHESATWKKIPASDEDLAAHEATGGFWLEMTPPALDEFKSGVFTVAYTLSVEGVDEDGELRKEEVRCGFGGQLARRFCVYGDEIDGTGLVDLGDVIQGQEQRTRLIVQIRDKVTDLKNVKLKVTPEFVEATWKHKADHLYLIDLVVPADAEVGDYSGNFSGSLEVSMEHPTIENQQFKLELDVLPKTTAR